MTRRRKSHEKKAADAGKSTVEQAVSPEHEQQAAAPVVAGDGGDASGAEPGEHQVEAAGEVGVSDGAAVGDGADHAGSEAPAEAPEGVASAPVHEAGEESVNDDADQGAVAGNDGDAGSESTAGAASVDKLGAKSDPDGGADHEDALSSVGDGDDGSGESDGGHGGARNGDVLPSDTGAGNVHGVGDAGEDAPRNHGGDANASGDDGGAELRAGPASAGPAGEAGAGGAGADASFLTALPRDKPLPVAAFPLEAGKISDGITLIATAAGMWASGLHAEAEHPEHGEGLLSLEMGEQLHDFVAKIRERATPEVMASQLVVLKHRETADPNWAQRVTLEVFRTLSLAALKRDDAIAAREHAAREGKAKPRPVPIDETTRELVDEPGATWSR